MGIKSIMVAAALLCAGLGASRAQAAVYVSGTVTVQQSSIPAPGARVAIYTDDPLNPVDITEALPNGSYVLRVPQAGQYHLSVSGAEYFATQKNVDVPAAGLAAADLAVEKRPSFRLQILAPDGTLLNKGEVQAYLAVVSERPELRLFARRRQVLAAVATAGDARADGTLDLLAPARLPDDAVITAVNVWVRSADRGYALLHLEDWPRGPVAVKLQRGAALVGTLLDGSGKPVAGATVNAVAQENDGGTRIFRGRATATTDAAGHFEIPALPPGSYVLRARSATGDIYTGEAILSSARAEVQLQPQATPIPAPVQRPAANNASPAAPTLEALRK